MKKIFKLIETNKKPERTLDSIKNEIRKYIKRERKKKLSSDDVYWEFDCKVGKTEEEAKSITQSEITSFLDETLELKLESCYIEIISKEVKKSKKEPETTDSDS